jgi:hypothetical protein
MNWVTNRADAPWRFFRLHYGAGTSQPWLTIARSNASVIVSWPLLATTWSLYATTNLAAGGSGWAPCTAKKTQPIAKIGVSRHLSIVIVEHSSELPLAPDAAHFGQKLGWFDKLVLDSLMITPLAIVTDVDREGFSEVCFAQEDQLVQTLFLDRAHKPFSVGV